MKFIVDDTQPTSLRVWKLNATVWNTSWNRFCPASPYQVRRLASKRLVGWEGGGRGEDRGGVYTFLVSLIRMFHWIVQWMLFFRQMYLALQNPEFPTWLYILITKHAKSLFDGKTSIPNPSFFWPFRSKTTLCFRGIKEQQIVSTTKNGGLHSRFSTCSWNSKKHSGKRPQGFWIWKETIKKNQI